ncbi:MAG: stage II sporulation protein P [Clostridia bacterium]|nr:stage II sporulation protein P [Clostridia bacterium]
MRHSNKNTRLFICRRRMTLALSILGCIAALALQSAFLGAQPLSGIISLNSPALLGVAAEAQAGAGADSVTALPRGDIRELLIPTLVPHTDAPESVTLASAGATQLDRSKPAVLIYHTHTTEAYNQTSQYQYAETGAWRTDNNTRNIVTVGAKLAELLENRYGIAVIHVTENFEPPKLSTSYDRSCAMLERYCAEYPTIELVIDVHRDAYTVNGENTDYVTIDGVKTARLMMVVGRGVKYAEAGSDNMRNYPANSALAELITEKLRDIDPALARDVRTKTGRYNQHIARKSLLVEVGHNANSLEEALAATDHLAFVIANYALGGTAGLFVP